MPHPRRSTLFPYTTLFRSLTNTCEVGTIDPQQSQVLGNVDDIFGKARNDLRQSFLYARTQMPLLGEFRFEEALRSEEHTSELQSHVNLVCRLLLAKKKPAE